MTSEDSQTPAPVRDDLTVRIDAPLPDRIELGAGTALTLSGTARLATGTIERLAVRIGEQDMPVDGMVALPGAEGPGVLWWAVMPLTTGRGLVPARIALLAESGPGGQEAEIGEVLLETGPAPVETGPAATAVQPLIAICMATYEPEEGWLERQLDSIRAQGWERWVCLISDDGSSAEGFARVERAVGGDPRFVVSQAARRGGFYTNFERALTMVPPEATFVALADQDDRWHPDKLEALVAELDASPGARLAYSDMRIVSEQGEVLSDTFWYLGQNGWQDIASMAILNTVTGAASVFRRELLDLALPFPPGGTGHHYHDHWLALCALASGEIAYLDRPTYDYTRHPESVTLTERDQWFAPPRSRREHVQVRWLRWTRRLRMGLQPLGWRRVYRERYLLIRQYVAVLRLRVGETMLPERRRALERLDRAERSPLAAAWLLGRSLRPLIGRRETLGRDRVLFGALVWRWSAAIRTRLRGRGRGNYI